MAKRNTLALGAAWLGLVAVRPSQAVTFIGNQLGGDGYKYMAQADFTYDSINNWLCILLTNTATTPVVNQGQTLSGVYFDVLGSPTITKQSAAMGAGSTIVNDVPNLNDSKIGQEYGFVNSMTAASLPFTDAKYGISSTGLGVFGPTTRFDTSGNLAGAACGAPGGDDFSLVPTVQASYVGGGLDTQQFTKNSVLFKLNVPMGFVLNADTIRNVMFHYGSGTEFQSTPGVPPSSVPEPSALAFLSCAGVATLAFSRRRKK